MVGRRRRTRWRGEPPPAAPVAAGRCALCDRPLGTRTERHHLVPRSEGGRETVPLHPIRHRAVHAAIPNRTLARETPDAASLRGRPELQPFLRWIAGKAPDFHAPTRRPA